MLTVTNKASHSSHCYDEETLQHYEVDNCEEDSHPPHLLNEQDSEIDFIAPKISHRSDQKANKTHICDETISNFDQCFKNSNKFLNTNKISVKSIDRTITNYDHFSGAQKAETQKNTTLVLDKRKIQKTTLMFKSLKKLAKDKSKIKLPGASPFFTRRKHKNNLGKQDDSTVETSSQETKEDSKRLMRHSSNISIMPFAALDDDIAASLIEAGIANNDMARELLEKERKEQHYYRETKFQLASMRSMKVLEIDQEDPCQETNDTEGIDWMNIIGFDTSGKYETYPGYEEIEFENLGNTRSVISASMSSVSSACLSLSSDESSPSNEDFEKDSFLNVSQENNTQSKNCERELHSLDIGVKTMEHHLSNDDDNRNEDSIIHLADSAKQQCRGRVPTQVVVSGHKKHRRFFSLKKEELLMKNVVDDSHEKEVISNQEILTKLSSRRVIKRYGSLSPDGKEFVKQVFNNEETKDKIHQ